MGCIVDVDMGYVVDVDMGRVINVDMGCVVDVDVGCVINVAMGRVVDIVDVGCCWPGSSSLSTWVLLLAFIVLAVCRRCWERL